MLARRISSPTKAVYNPKAFILHAAWLDQACAHCPKFPTAASRRSLGRVSVPVWLVVLSDQLQIVGLVSLYPTNYLICHRPLHSRKVLRSPAFIRRSYAVLAQLSLRYPHDWARSDVLLTRSPLAARIAPALPFDLHV